MEWTESESNEETIIPQNLPEAVPKIDHDGIFKAFADPTLPKAIAKTMSSRTPAQDRLKRLQNALKQNQKKSPQKQPKSPARAASSVQNRPKVTPPSVQNRLKVTPSPKAPPQAKKRKAPDEEEMEVPEKKRHVSDSPRPVAQRPKIQAKGFRMKRPVGRLPSCTATSSAQSCSSSVPASPPKKARFSPKKAEKFPGSGNYRVSVNCTEDNRLIINYEESQGSNTPNRKSLEDGPKDLSKIFYVVVDTNIFCHNLIFLDNILNMRFRSIGYAILVIPYIVIQELDRLKHQSYSLELENNAAKAIKFINEKLQARHPQVKGQKEMAQSDVFLINPFNPDDSVLNCCLLIKQTTNKVILLTNDINLRNKALVNAINAFKPTDLREDLAIDFL